MSWSRHRTNFERSIAVVIGINDYQNGIHKLATPVNDAMAIANLLETEYDYQEIIRLFPPDNEATLENLNKLLVETLPNKIQPTEADVVRLLFYFAGHGVARNGDSGPVGYLIPQDAKIDDINSFLPMRELNNALCALNCHHLLTILDCCFAGAFRWSTTRNAISVPETIHREHYDRFIRYPACQVITSAAHNQEALDFLADYRGTTKHFHSPFALAFIQGLQEKKADFTGDNVITAPELYLYIRDQLINGKKEFQTPGLWYLPKHDRGEYIFTKKGFEPKTLKTAPSLVEESNNPYRGLKPFDEKHSCFFFGRKALVEELSKRVSQSDQQLTIVLGVSGSGKSSLVKAGLIPYLRNNQAQQWYILDPIRPGKFPFTTLARAILPVADANLINQLEQVSFLNEIFQLTSEKKSKNQRFAFLRKIWNNATTEAKLLVIVDYFHEFLNLCQHQEQQQNLSNLNQAILDCFKPLVKNLQKDKEYFVHLIAAWCQKNLGKKLLLAIDQFEELITLSPHMQQQSDKQEQKQWQQFLEILYATLVAHPQQFRVVVTLRSDFEPCFLNSALKPLWKKEHTRFLLRAMTNQELRQAIEEPALKQALYFEPGTLVDTLIDEVGQMPGALPLLSFTLSELYIMLHNKWVKKEVDDRAIKEEYYKELGGVVGSLTRRATEEYNKLVKDFGEEVGKTYQATMRRVMLRMVALAGGELARRRVPISELHYSNLEENKRRNEVIDRLVKARLIVKGQEREESYVEPAHDYLVRGWDKLQEWIKQEERNLVLQQRLTLAANDWDKNDRTINYLWIRDPRLEFLKHLPTSNNSWLSKLEMEFVQESLKERHNELEQTQEQLQISEEQRKAAEEAQTATKLELESVTSLRQFEIEKNLESLLSAMHAGQELEDWRIKHNNPPLQDYPTVSPLFTLQAILDNIQEQNRFNVTSDDTIWQILEKGFEEQQEIKFDIKSQKSLTFSSPNNNYSLAIEDKKNIIIFGKNQQPITESFQILNHIQNVLFSPNGQIIAIIGNYFEQISTVVFLNLSGRQIGKFMVRDENFFIEEVVFSPDSQKVAIIERLNDGEETQFLHFFSFFRPTKYGSLELLKIGDGGRRGYFGKIGFTKDDRSLASGHPSIQDIHSITLWNLQPKLQSTLQLVELTEDERQKFWLPSSAIIDTNWAHGRLKCKKREEYIEEFLYYKPLNENQQIAVLEGEQSWFKEVIFSPAGLNIATLGEDDIVRLWNLSGDQLAEPKKYQNSIQKIFFSIDGQYIITIGDEGMTISSISSEPEAIAKIGGSSSSFFSSVSFSPDGQRIATVGLERVVRLWDLRGRQLAELSLTNPQTSLTISCHWYRGDGTDPCVSFTPDGKHVVIEAAFYSTKLLWKVEGLNDLLQRGSQWLRNYTHQKSISR